VPETEKGGIKAGAEIDNLVVSYAKLVHETVEHMFAHLGSNVVASVCGIRGYKCDFIDWCIEYFTHLLTSGERRTTLVPKYLRNASSK
jgi:hypothetical protein